MIKGNFYSGMDVLYDQKNISIEEKRKIAATVAALELISIAVSSDGSERKLAEEMKNLKSYVAAIYDELSQQ